MPQIYLYIENDKPIQHARQDYLYLWIYRSKFVKILFPDTVPDYFTMSSFETVAFLQNAIGI